MLNFLCTKKQAVKSYFSAVALCLKSVVISEVGEKSGQKKYPIIKFIQKCNKRNHINV